jgi:hypothetical protein
MVPYRAVGEVSTALLKEWLYALFERRFEGAGMPSFPPVETRRQGNSMTESKVKASAG